MRGRLLSAKLRVCVALSTLRCLRKQAAMVRFLLLHLLFASVSLNLSVPGYGNIVSPKMDNFEVFRMFNFPRLWREVLAVSWEALSGAAPCPL